jgi:hypothetical protein
MGSVDWRRSRRTLGFLLVALGCLAAGCEQAEVKPPAEESPAEESPAEVPTAADDAPGNAPGDGEAAANADDGFRAIRLADCRVFPPAAAGAEPTWTETAGGLLVSTGTPRGYLYTAEEYGDFTLRLEFRYPLQDGMPPADPKQANTGVLIFIGEEHRVWPRCLEVQGRFDEMAEIKSNARDVKVTSSGFDPAARDAARCPIGEWNQLTITSRDGAVTSELNGQHIAHSEPTALRSGPIGLQAEGYPAEFRGIEIQVSRSSPK